LVTVKALAKINLTLEVLRKRPDGYHEIRSVLQAIDLYDTLYIQAGKGVSFKCDMREWSAGKSLVNKAVALLQESGSIKKGAAITLEKQIPMMAGLGGDSSDAAALLKGLNDFWRLNLSNERLQEPAAQLGSDVAFFLRGGTALADGRGEIITPLPALPKMYVVLVVPDIPGEPGKTGRMYAALKTEHFTCGGITEKLIQTLHKDNHFDTSLLFNAFENVAFDMYPGLMTYQERLINLDAPQVHLAGSGPTLFSIMPDKARAEALYRKCKSQMMNAYLAQTL
jgi:4-diphosphocytidyl-2-C-methyl-D-erythritol kinase